MKRLIPLLAVALLLTGCLHKVGSTDLCSEADAQALACGLTRITGDVTLTTGQTLENAYVDGGCVSVVGDDAVIRNTYVRAEHVCYVEGIPAAVSTGENNYTRNLLIEDSIIRLVENSSTSFDNNGVGQTGWTIIDSEIIGGAKIVKCDGYCRLQDSYVHDKNNQHGEAVFYDGGAGNFVISHNVIDPKPDAVTTGGIAFTSGYPNTGPIFVNGNEVWGGQGRPFVGCHRNSQPDWATYCATIRFEGNILHDEADSTLPSYGFVDPAAYPSLNLTWFLNEDGNGNTLPVPGARP